MYGKTRDKAGRVLNQRKRLRANCSGGQASVIGTLEVSRAKPKLLSSQELRHDLHLMGKGRCIEWLLAAGRLPPWYGG